MNELGREEKIEGEGIRLGQIFRPLDKESPFCEWSGGAVTATILIDLSLEEPEGVVFGGRSPVFFSIVVARWGSVVHRGFFRPFEIENSYRVDNRDFQEKEREKKLREAKGKFLSPKHPSGVLSIVSRGEGIRASGLVGKDGKFSPEVSDYLRKLRVQIFVAGQSYEARPSVNLFPLNVIFFDEFYPLDSPSLVETDRFKEIGQRVLLPTVPKMLTTLEMRMVLETKKEAVKEEPGEQE